MEGTPRDSFTYHEATIINTFGSSTTVKIPVVQELARHGVQDIPNMFLRPHSDSITTTHSCSPHDFPSVSLARLRDTTRVEDQTQELQKLARGAEEWGMILVSDHGIPVSVLDEVKEVIKKFFELSIEEKRKCVGTYASTDNMGYGRNYVKSEDQILEWIDRLTMMAAPKASTPGLHVWPLNPPDFRDKIEQYVEEARNVGDQVLEALAEALSLHKNAFLRYFDPETSEIRVRINFYPPCPKPNSTLGLNPHSDPSAVSLLIQIGNSGGLQAMHKDENVWRTIPWPTDAFLVTIGDLLEIMSNGRLYSGLHRVISQPDVERMSVALFYSPASTTEIEPQKEEHSDDDKYKKVVVGDYVQHYYKVSPAYGKQTTLEYARV
ncbi:hypothetical protein RND81_03G126100 [Saponaria officinalis]|uniref:Fe2OG dioxygenase domain-containing protein n=1 Tax=Saponaria officinalis TaxID=3572 RepID=A0AAW1M627_SAPOF